MLYFLEEVHELKLKELEVLILDEADRCVVIAVDLLLTQKQTDCSILGSS